MHRALVAVVLPRVFRRRYDSEISSAFDDLYAESRGRGPAAVLELWLREIRAMLSTRTRLHRRAPHPRPPGDATMRAFLDDLRFALRNLRRSPGFTVVALVTLALGIGATTTMFSVVHGILLSALPYPESERLVLIAEAQAGTRDNVFVASPANAADWAAQQQTLDGLAIVNLSFTTIPEEGGLTQLNGATVSHSFFDVIGAQPMLGRDFSPDEQGPESTPVTIISYGTWQQYFGGDSALVGRTIRLGNTESTVVGIMPRGYRSPEEHYFGPSDFWVPLTFDPAAQGRRGHWVRVFGRIRAGVTIEEAQTEFDGIQRRIHLEDPGADFEDHVPVVHPLRDAIAGDIRPALLLLLGAVGLVLIVACTNIGNLMLARAVARRHELALRTALGAGRARIVREVLSESTLLSLGGAASGLIITWLVLPKLIGFAPDLPRPEDVGINLPVVVFAVGAALTTGVLFGLIPAFGVLRHDPQQVLRETDRSGSGGRERQRLRQSLVVIEVGLSLMLLIGAGLLVRSFMRLMAVDPGFSADHVVTAQLRLPGGAEGTNRLLDLTNVLTRVRALPGVQSAGTVSTLPLHGLNNLSFSVRVDGVEYGDDDRFSTSASFRTVTPGYFDAMDVTVLRGRSFTDADGANAPQVAVVNDVFVERYLQAQDPIGRRVSDFQFANIEFDGTIVGVIRGVRYENLQIEATPELYVPFDQMPALGIQFLAARGMGRLPITSQQLRSVIREVNPSITMNDVTAMAQRVSEATARPRFNMMLLSGFAVFALILAAINLYAVIGYTVTQRRREIAIRMALGAEVGRVVRYVVKGGAVLVFIGAILGLVGAFAASRLLASMLYDVSPFDPLTFIAIPAITIGVALLASYWPARRIARVHPTIALRG
jgi:putative ABC transport system permease protein